MFSGIGYVQKRVFLFGGKEPETKEITNKAYEIIWNNEDSIEMVPINRMFKNRGRSTIACIDKASSSHFDPFVVIIGGSDEFSSLNLCELYYPSNDTYYSFPHLNVSRENASVCIMGNQNQSKDTYIYCFGGFDKKSID